MLFSAVFSRLTKEIERYSSMTKRILVVESDPDRLERISGLLVDSGFEVVSCGSRPMALSLLNQHKIHCVIINDSLSAYNGASLSSEISHLPCYRDLPIIMLTGAKKRDFNSEKYCFDTKTWLCSNVDGSILVETVSELL